MREAQPPIVYARRGAEVFTEMGLLKGPIPCYGTTTLITACSHSKFRLAGQIATRGGACPFGKFEHAAVAQVPCRPPANSPLNRAGFQAEKAFDILSLIPLGIALLTWIRSIFLILKR